MPEANNRQVGGEHYKTKNGVQHWDWACNLPYLEGITTGYIGRHAEKGGFEDLLKGLHCLEKMMETYYPDKWVEHRVKEREEIFQSETRLRNLASHLTEKIMERALGDEEPKIFYNYGNLFHDPFYYAVPSSLSATETEKI